MSKNVFNVVIIGAGISGLAAAKHLYSHGIKDIKILEAQNYLGGRVCTKEHNGKPLEYGAQYIHGEEGNVVCDFAKDTNSIDETSFQFNRAFFVREDGEKVSEENIEKIMTLLSKMSEDSEQVFSDYKGSVGEYFTQAFSSLNEWGELGMEFLDWQARMTCIVNGCDSWFESSGTGQVTFKECPGESIINWKDGYRTLIRHYEASIPSSIISLNTPVKEIKWRTAKTVNKKDAELSIPNKSANKKYSDSCNISLDLGNDECIHTNQLIVTVSLGVLKSCAEDLFSPSLPLVKKRAIEGLGIDAFVKILIEFPHRWWPVDCEGFNLLHKIKEDSDNPMSWESKILRFYTVHQHPNMLGGFVSGKAAIQVENETVENVSRICLSLLRKYVKGYVIPEPIFVDRTQWYSNPYIRGAYSFLSMKSEEMNVRHKDLAQPICNEDGFPIICFAGEATHDCFYSTVHGAVETGIREAERILKTKY